MGVSGVLRYFGPVSSSRSLRAPKPTTSPVMSRIGQIRRPRNRSMGPRRPSCAMPEASSSRSVKPRPRVPALLVPQGDPGLPGQPLDGLGEGQVLDLHDEGDGVAALLAAEAVPGEDVVLQDECMA